MVVGVGKACLSISETADTAIFRLYREMSKESKCPVSSGLLGENGQTASVLPSSCYCCLTGMQQLHLFQLRCAEHVAHRSLKQQKAAPGVTPVSYQQEPEATFCTGSPKLDGGLMTINIC